MTDTANIAALIEAVERGNIASVSAHHIKLALGGHYQMYFCGAFAGSLDAASALHRKLLPGWRLSDMGEADCTLSGWFARLTMRGTVAQSISAFDQPHAARAWLLSILRAHQSQQETGQ